MINKKQRHRISEVRVISLGKRNQPHPHRLGCRFQGRGSKGPTNSLSVILLQISAFPKDLKVDQDYLTSAHLGHTWQQPSENPDTQEWKSLDQVEETCVLCCQSRAVRAGASNPRRDAISLLLAIQFQGQLVRNEMDLRGTSANSPIS